LFLGVPALFHSNVVDDDDDDDDNNNNNVPTIHGQHHPRADIDRLYAPRKEGRRGLVYIEGAYITEVMKLMEFVESEKDPFIRIVRTHQHHTNSTLLQTFKDFMKSFQSQTKGVKNIIVQNMKRVRRKGRMGNSHVA
jgi:hypothetical protein